MKVVVVLLVFAFGTTMLVEVAGIIGQNCEEDHQCVGSENIKEYCYISRQCVACTDCKKYYRSDPQNLSCAKEPKYCGSCSSGYKEDNLTDGRRRDTCIPIPSTGDNSDLTQYSILTISLGILIGLILVTTGFIYFYKIKKERNQNASPSNSHNVREEHVESGIGMLQMPIDNPPQYEEILPSAPLLPVTERESVERITEEVGVKLSYNNEVNLVAHAIPHHYARYNENYNPPVNDEEGADEEAPDGLQMFSPNYHDEDTMESNWTPGTGSAQHTSGTADGGGDDDGAGAHGGVVNPEEAGVMAAINEMANIDEVNETDREEEEASSETNTNLNDSGVSDNSCQTSSSSLSRPFAQFGSATTSSMEDTRGVTRSHSDDDLSTSGTINKRQRHDDTQSLDEGTVPDI